MFFFKGKRALVTGAGKGIGRDLAKKLVQSGAETFALSRTLSDLESLKEESPSINIVHCDLSDFSNIERHIKSCLPIDLLVNNAAIVVPVPFLEASADVYDKVMDINLKAPFLISQIVAREMVSRETGGSIVNVSSKLAERALERFSIHSMTKSALDQMTRSMALELGTHKIRVNSIQPTVILTDSCKNRLNESTAALLSKIPLKRFGEVEDVNSVIMFLLSDQAAMITGSCIPVDGGALCAL